MSMNNFTSKMVEARSGIDHRIWDKDLAAEPYLRRFVLKTIRIIYATLRDLRQGQLSLRAMSLVYTTVISLVPLLALSFSVLKGFGAHNQLEPWLNNLLTPLGEKSHEISAKIIQFVNNVQVGVLGTAGLGLLIYSVVSMMQKIERSFNYIWRVHKGRSFGQRFSEYLSVLLVGPFLIFLSAGLTTTVRSNDAVNYLKDLPVMGEALAVIGFVVPYLIMAAAFAFLYSFMPNTRVKIGSAFIGGLITAIIWKTMGWGFTQFVVKSSSNTAIYSAFASLIIFMVWVYVGWLVLLIGASIAYYHQNPNMMMIKQGNFEISNEDREKLGLNLFHIIAESFNNGSESVTLDKLVERSRYPEIVISPLLDILEKNNLIIQSREKGFYPARAIEKIQVREVLTAIRTACKGINSPNSYQPAVENYFKSWYNSQDKKFKDMTVKDLVSGDK